MGHTFSKLVSWTKSHLEPTTDEISLTEPDIQDDEIFFAHETLSPGTRPEIIKDLIQWGLQEELFRQIESDLYLISRGQLEDRLEGELSFEEGLGIWKDGKMMYVCKDGKWERVEEGGA